MPGASSEIRLLSSIPASGYALPAVSSTVSPLAALARGHSLAANPAIVRLPRPRSVHDQADVPCCVSCALAGAMEILHPEWPPLAPLFHYFVTRFDNHAADRDGLLILRPAILTLTTQGICRLDLHGLLFTDVGVSTRPSRQAFTDASTRLLRGPFFSYRPIPQSLRVTQIRDELRRGYPVVIGVTLPERYRKGIPNSQGEWADPNEPASTVGLGHCLLVLEASDARQALLVQDSRGPKEFVEGCWWLGYRVAGSSVVREAYSLTGR
jgi:hypothetical protein